MSNTFRSLLQEITEAVGAVYKHDDVLASDKKSLKEFRGDNELSTVRNIIERILRSEFFSRTGRGGGGGIDKDPSPRPIRSYDVEYTTTKIIRYYLVDDDGVRTDPLEKYARGIRPGLQIVKTFFETLQDNLSDEGLILDAAGRAFGDGPILHPQRLNSNHSYKHVIRSNSSDELVTTIMLKNLTDPNKLFFIELDNSLTALNDLPPLSSD